MTWRDHSRRQRKAARDSEITGGKDLYLPSTRKRMALELPQKSPPPKKKRLKNEL